MSQRQSSCLGQLAKRSFARTTSNRSRNTLGNEEPPRDDVAIPGVDDDVYVLIQQVPLDDGDALFQSSFVYLVATLER
jgi:hypothetical protein